MRSQWQGFQGPLASEMGSFVAAKRALGRRYVTEEKALRLFDTFLAHGRVGGIVDVTPEVVDSFLASRSYRRPRSHNMLLGIVRCLFDWLVRHWYAIACPPFRGPHDGRSRPRIHLTPATGGGS